jgi:hypothetical protein
MYYPDTNATVKLTGSPSLLMNNLSASKGDSMVSNTVDLYSYPPHLPGSNALFTYSYSVMCE